MNFKNINIGNLIFKTVQEKNINISRICKFMKCNEKTIQEMYNSSDISAENLLRWSKLLEYDFFRLYSQHLILYSPVAAMKNDSSEEKSHLPYFRKNIYTKEIINFILEQLETNQMSKKDVIDKYNIPKTTLSKWIKKYTNE